MYIAGLFEKVRRVLNSVVYFREAPEQLDLQEHGFHLLFLARHETSLISIANRVSHIPTLKPQNRVAQVSWAPFLLRPLFAGARHFPGSGRQ